MSREGRLASARAAFFPDVWPSARTNGRPSSGLDQWGGRGPRPKMVDNVVGRKPPTSVSSVRETSVYFYWRTQDGHGWRKGSRVERGTGLWWGIITRWAGGVFRATPGHHGVFQKMPMVGFACIPICRLTVVVAAGEPAKSTVKGPTLASTRMGLNGARTRDMRNPMIKTSATVHGRGREETLEKIPGWLASSIRAALAAPNISCRSLFLVVGRWIWYVFSIRLRTFEIAVPPKLDSTPVFKNCRRNFRNFQQPIGKGRLRTQIDAVEWSPKAKLGGNSCFSAFFGGRLVLLAAIAGGRRFQALAPCSSTWCQCHGLSWHLWLRKWMRGPFFLTGVAQARGPFLLPGHCLQ